MAGGPPSSIDIGDGSGGPPSSIVGDGSYYGDGGGESSSTSSLTYFERKYGGGDGSDVDPSAFLPSYTPTDKGEGRIEGQIWEIALSGASNQTCPFDFWCARDV